MGVLQGRLNGIGIALGLLCTSGVGQTEPPYHSAEALPLARTARQPNVIHYLDHHNSVFFEDREYPVETAIPLLVQVAIDSRAPGSRRRHALDRLKLIAAHPAMATHVPALVRAYVEENDGLIRGGLLMCLSSTSERALLGFYEHVLDTERDEWVRLQAAVGLAQWNARGGIEEMVALLGSERPLGRWPLGGEALIVLERLNDWQGWGMPLKSIMEELRRTCDSGSGVGAEEVLAPLAQKAEEWLAANRERFPVIPQEERDLWRAKFGLAGEPGQAPTASNTSQSVASPAPIGQPATSEGAAGAAQPGVEAEGTSQPPTNSVVHLDSQAKPDSAPPKITQTPSATAPGAEASATGVAQWAAGGALVLVVVAAIVALRIRGSRARPSGQ